MKLGCSEFAERRKRFFAALTLVEKMTHAGKDHCETETIGCGNDVIVADGTAGLNEGGRASFRGFFDAIGEGEESIGRDDGAL
jgi:hypothetical protein